MIHTINLQMDMPNVETLSLNRNGIQVFDGQHWARLKILFIDHNPIQAFKNEHELSLLEVLSIEYQKEENTLAVDLLKFTQLRELRVSGKTLPIVML
jgi:Leucine-rich repeat (LRR) protein